MNNDISRRAFLAHGTALAISASLATRPLAAEPVHVRNPRSAASAAGTLWIGGDLQVNRIGLGTARLTGERR